MCLYFLEFYLSQVLSQSTIIYQDYEYNNDNHNIDLNLSIEKYDLQKMMVLVKVCWKRVYL